MTHTEDAESQGHEASPAMFCRKCGYELAGLSENRCPECGQPFDPADDRTFLRHPQGWLLRRWLRRITWGLLALVVLLAALLGGTIAVLHSRGQTQEKAIAAVHKAGGRALITRSTSHLLVVLFGCRTNQGLSNAVGPGVYRPGLFGTRFGYLNDRVELVYLRGGWLAGSSDDWEDLPVDDALLAELPNFRYATRIEIASRQVTDAGVEQLRDLPTGAFVSLRCPRVRATGSDLRWPDRPGVHVLKLRDPRSPPGSRPADSEPAPGGVRQ